MFNPGDVIHFYSQVAGKPKWHLCVSLDGCFLFINSPKVKAYLGDFVVPCSELPFLPLTASGESIISCNIVLRLSDQELRRSKAAFVGSISKSLLLRLFEFLERSEALSEEDREACLDGLQDWL